MSTAVLNTKNSPLTVGQAADLLRISSKTLRNWGKKGILNGFRTKGGQRRYWRENIDKFLLRKELARTYSRQISTNGKKGQNIGSGIIRAGEDKVEILNSAITDSSRVFVTATSFTGGQILVVDKKPGEGFVVKIEEVYNSDINFDWWVVDEKK